MGCDAKALFCQRTHSRLKSQAVLQLHCKENTERAEGNFKQNY